MPLPSLSPSTSPPVRALRLAGGILIATVIFVTLLLFDLAMIISLPLKLISTGAYRRFIWCLADLWGGLCCLGAENVHGVRFVTSGDVLPPDDNAVVLTNHQTMTDVAVVIALARRTRRIGVTKWLGKDMIKYFPAVGWGLYLYDCILLKRNWTEDRGALERVIGRVRRERIPLWLMLFAEGTRITPEKLARSQAYAEQRGLVPMRHVLLPRTKGFVVMAQTLGDHIDAIYDVTIGYVDGVPSLWQWIEGHVRRVHVHVRRFPRDRVPGDDDKLADWLLACYRDKDALLAAFYRDGAFPACPARVSLELVSGHSGA